MLTEEVCRRCSGRIAGRRSPSRSRGGRGRMHGRMGHEAEEVGVAVVQPNVRERTKLRAPAIQEAKRARGGAVCDREEPPEMRGVGYDAAAETLAMG